MLQLVHLWLSSSWIGLWNNFVSSFPWICTHLLISPSLPPIVYIHGGI